MMKASVWLAPYAGMVIQQMSPAVRHDSKLWSSRLLRHFKQFLLSVLLHWPPRLLLLTASSQTNLHWTTLQGDADKVEHTCVTQTLADLGFRKRSASTIAGKCGHAEHFLADRTG